MTWLGWIVVAFCWSLPFACYAVRHWRIRVYFTQQDPPSPQSRLVSEGSPVGANEAKDSSQRREHTVLS